MISLLHWVPSIIIVLLSLLAVVFQYGRLDARVQSLEVRLECIDRKLEALLKKLA